MEVILIVLLIGLVIGFIVYLANYLTHIQMSLGEHLPYDYVHFNTFVQEFAKYKYNPELLYNKDYKSIFLKCDYKYIVYLHASIIKFNDKCMIFYPISWIRYLLWVKKNFKKECNRKKGLWNKKPMKDRFYEVDKYL